MELPSNQTCQLCEGHPASHFCNCLSPPTLFCMDCFPRHHAKYPYTAHRIYPIGALHHNPEYLRKMDELKRAAAELRSNLDRMEQFSYEFVGMIEVCVNYLNEYRSWWVQQLQTEKAQLSVTIDVAVQEITKCLDQGTEPESGLGRVLWKGQDLQVFSSSITPPDLQTMCQTWASYHISLPPEEPTDLHLDVDYTIPEESKLSLKQPQKVLKPPLPHLFAAVYMDKVELYDLQSQQSTKRTLPVNFGNGGSYIQVDTHTLLCLGAQPASTVVYGLDLPSLTLTSLPELHTPRCLAGIAKAALTVFVFGGCEENRSVKSCEKFVLEDRQWRPLYDMGEGRYAFTPCTFGTLIYLPCPHTTLTIETFSPQTETFTVLPVSLPPAMKGYGSVSFVVNGELCVLTGGKQMGRWRIESEGKFRLFDTDRECGSTQPPLIVDSLVLIANNRTTRHGVEKFSLESYSFH